MAEINITKPSSQTIERLRNRIYKRSHSLGSVQCFDKAVKALNRYMEATGMSYSSMVADPYRGIDDFATWLDQANEPSVTRGHVTYVKKLLRADGAVIDRERFREEVTLPLATPFNDAKVTESQIRRIILATKNQKLKLLLMLMKDMPVRPIEMLGLTLGNFDLESDPPMVTIPTHLAKSNLPRENFFTPETKQVLVGYLQDRGIEKPEQFILINGRAEMYDELALQKRLQQKVIEMNHVFREQILSRPEFSDMHQRVENRRGKAIRYKIHLYSFKKFSFTKTVDTIGDLAARALKGDRQYVLTYYKKTKKERASDYKKLIPKLSIFTNDEELRQREQILAQVNALDDKALARLQEFLRLGTARTKPEGSHC